MFIISRHSLNGEMFSTSHQQSTRLEQFSSAFLLMVNCRAGPNHSWWLTSWSNCLRTRTSNHPAMGNRTQILWLQSLLIYNMQKSTALCFI